MAASANPSDNQEGGQDSSVNGHAKTKSLKHNPGLALDWSAEELSILEDGLNKYASDRNLVRYAKIAMKLQDKTIRDVAFRCRWMSKKEIGKRRKAEDLNRKSKDRKEKMNDSSAKPSNHLAGQSNLPPYALQVLPVESDDGISYKAIGGATGHMFKQNVQLFNQIQANLASYKVQENVSLLCQTRDNILTILNDLNDMPAIMKQMPPLPVKMNEELATSILPRSSMHMQS